MAVVQDNDSIKFKKNGYICWGLLLASGVIYGSSFSWMKVAMNDGANALGLVFWFSLIASLALACELILVGRFFIPDIRSLKFCIPWAILSVILPNLFFFYAAGKIQSSMIAVSIALVPTFTLIGAVLLKRERLNFRRSLGLMIGAAGIMMILLPDTSLPKANDTIFVLVSFLGAACYAAEHLYIEINFPTSLKLDQLLFLMFISSLIMLFPIVFMVDAFIPPKFPFGDMEYAILAVATVTLIDYFFITLLILWAGPVFTSQAAYIVTLAGVIWGIVIFEDSHSLWIWGAICMLITGLSFVRPQNKL